MSRERQRRKESQGQGSFSLIWHPASSENPDSSQHFFHQLLTFFKVDCVNIFHIPFYPFFLCMFDFLRDDNFVSVISFADDLQMPRNNELAIRQN